MPLSLGEVARALGGTLRGDPARVVAAVRAPADAGPDEIAVVTDRKLLARLAELRAGALVVPPGTDAEGRDVVVVAAPRRALATLLALLHPEPRRAPGVDPTAAVAPDVRLGRDVFVGPHATIERGAAVGDRCQLHAGVVVGEGVSVGDDTVLFPNVVLYPGTRVGARVRVHAASVVGSDGFGYQPGASGLPEKVPQVGGVSIEDDVEIGAGCAIDRATLGTTRIGRGTKIDNLVQVGHNCDVGPGCIVIGQAGLAGSVTLGAGTTVAGQAGIADHVTVAPGTVVGAQAGVPSDLAPGVYLGTPAVPAAVARRMFPLQARLPEMKRTIQALEERCRVLEDEVRRLSTRGDGGA